MVFYYLSLHTYSFLFIADSMISHLNNFHTTNFISPKSLSFGYNFL